MACVRIKNGRKDDAYLIGKYHLEHLNNQQRIIFLMLMGKPLVSVWQMIDALWPNPDLQPLAASRIIHVHIRHIRNKLKAVDADFEIINHHAKGYSLEAIQTAAAAE